MFRVIKKQRVTHKKEGEKPNDEGVLLRHPRFILGSSVLRAVLRITQRQPGQFTAMIVFRKHVYR